MKFDVKNSVEQRTQRGGGIGLLGGMFLVFLTLKLIGEISWSWWWVTAPLWMPWAILAAFLLVVGGLYLILTWFIKRDDKRRKQKIRDSYSSS